MDFKNEWFNIFIYSLFSAMGGLVRELTNKNPHSFWGFVSGAFIGVFCGLVIYFLCKNYGVSEYLSAALTGLAGYMGTPLMDLLGSLFKKKLKNGG